MIVTAKTPLKTAAMIVSPAPDVDADAMTSPEMTTAVGGENQYRPGKKL